LREHLTERTKPVAINDEIPKSRITLTYRTDVSGEKEERDLPYRLLVCGDLSLEKPTNGSTDSKERALDLDKRKVRDLNGVNLNEVMADIGAKLSVQVDNKINDKGQVDVNLSLDSMKSFSPDSIVDAVPELKSLVLLRKLLLEAQSNLDNRKEFRNKIRDLNALRRAGEEDPSKKQAAQDAITGLLSELGDGFGGFKLPTPQSEAPADESAE
jgi:type VI secretion system protein ImpB